MRGGPIRKNNFKQSIKKHIQLLKQTNHLKKHKHLTQQNKVGLTPQ